MLLLLLLGSICTSHAAAEPLDSEQQIDFDESILPLISDRCFQCHGPDEAARESGLRLDTREGAFAAGDSGELAIVPGNLTDSAIYHRITSDDPDLVMPPPESGLSLQAEEKDLLRSWIEQGANWKQHWAFVPPKKPAIPSAHPTWSADQTIDNFIHRKISSTTLTPSPKADKETLIRRATLDLTGLPPTISEIDAFLSDESPDAFSKVIDRLMASSRYGEHMARIWLDAARYADTHGLILIMNVKFGLTEIGSLTPSISTCRLINLRLNRLLVIYYPPQRFPSVSQPASIVAT